MDPRPLLNPIAWCLAVVFGGLAALHLSWARGSSSSRGYLAALPTRADGQPLFLPGPLACAAVALLLSLAGLLAIGAEGSLDLGPLPQALVRALAGAAGGVLLLRAVGDFRWGGFFKSNRSSAT